MKKGLLPAITIGIAVLVIGSIAYASDRKKNTKNMNFLDDKIHEEEALKAELLKPDDHEDKTITEIERLKEQVEDEVVDNNQTSLLAEVVR